MNPETEVDERQTHLVESQNLANEVTAVKRIETDDQYRRVAQVHGTLKAALEFFEERARPNIQRWWQGHQQALKDLKADRKAAEEGYNYSGRLLSDFDRRKQEEKERLEREAERKRKEAEAEQQRLAALAEELGSPETAEEIEEAPVDPGPVIAKAVPRVEGLSYRHGGWSWAIENRDLIPDDFWIVDERSITAIVNRLGKQAEKVVGGIVVVEKPKIPIQR